VYSYIVVFRTESKLLNSLIGIVIGTAGVVLITVLLSGFGNSINATTVALAFILLIVLAATFLDWVSAIAASLLAAFSFNFYFLEPHYTLRIDDPENWVSLFVFLSVAITVAYLSASVNRRRAEAERLYKEIEAAFEKASEAEGIKRSEKLKGALLDAVTHDFRTPLTSIKASVTMLIDENQFGSKESKLDRHSRGELLNVIEQETDRLNTFVESMVELARFQSGSSELKLSKVTAEEIIVKAAKRAKDIQRTHQLISNVATDLPGLSLDSRFIVEAVFNLIDNAAKYSPANTKIEITAKRNGDNVRFEIEDEGPGIPTEDRESVFKKFYQRESHKDRGMGMGLAIVRGIIEAHGGEIWVESGKKGARFVFDLPANNNGTQAENSRGR
jgi:two-component system sensor histidine kinase KdpD